MYKNVYKYFILAVLLFFVVSINAQDISNQPSSKLRERANYYYKIFSYKKALIRYLELKKRGDNSKDTLYRIAFSYYKLRKRTKAENYFKLLADRYSNSLTGARANHILSLMKARRYYYRKDAINYAKKVWEYFKDHPRYKNIYSKLIYKQMKAFIRNSRLISWFLEEIFNEYIDDMDLNRKEYEKAMYYKGMLYYRIGKYIRNYRDRREWYREGKNFKIAKEAWDKLLDKYPNTKYGDKIVFLLAVGYRKMSKFVTAIKYYKRVIKKYPNSLYVSDSKKAIYEIRKPIIRVRTPRPFFPGKNDGYLKYASRNVSKIKISMYKVNLISFLRRNENLLNTSKRDLSKINKKGLKFVKSWIFTTPDKNDHIPLTGKIKIKYNKRGAYVLFIKAGKMQGALLYIVSDISLVTKKSKKRVIGFVVNGKTSKPYKGATVYINENFNNRQYRNIAKTRSNGIASFPLPKNVNRYTRMVAKVGNNYAISRAYYYFYRYSSRYKYSAYIFTDRPVYRPKQTVYIKAIMREASAGKYLVVSNKPVHVYVVDSRRKRVFDKIIKTSNNGTFNFKIKLKEGARLGRYMIYTKVDRYTIYGYRNRRYSPYFRVEEYKRPEYEVKINTVQQDFVIGDTITAKINSKYYFGQPVSGAKIRVQVKKYWHLSGVPWHILRKYYRKYRYRFSYMYRGNKSVKAKQGKTDNKGNFYIEFETEKISTPDDLEPYVKYTYRINAQVIDSSRRQINGNYSFNVSKTSFIIKSTPQRKIYTTGDRARVSIRTETPAGIPISKRITLGLYKYQWINENWKKKLFRKIKVKTNSQGEYEFKAKIREQGFIVLEALSYDKRQNKVTGSSSFWVVSDKYRGGFYRYRGIEIITDKKTYKPGDTIKILINTEYKYKTLLVSIEGKTLYKYKVVRLKGNAKLVKFRVRKHWSPNVYVKVNTVFGHKLYTEKKKVVVPPVHHYISVKMRFNKRSYLPGQRAYVDIKTLDWRGRQVSAEVALSIYDRSLLYIQPRISPDIRKFYYAGSVGNNIRTYYSNSFNDRVYVYNPDLVKPNFTTNRYPAIFGKYYYRYAFYGKHRYRRSDGEVEESARATGGAVPQASPSPGGRRLLRSSRRSRREQNGRRPRAADDGPEQEGAPATIRKNFNETILWKPTLITRARGWKRVYFKFADSLTTWQVVARAVKAPTEVGETTENLVTTKNIIVRLQSPRFFTERDRCYVSAIVHNYLKKKQRVRIVLHQKGNLRIIGKRSKTVYIQANGKYRANFIVSARKFGNTQITVSAITRVESDAMQKKFKILPYGSDRFVAWNGDIYKNGTKVIYMNVPAQRRVDATTLKIVVTPSIAMSMLDALPYLAKYPYGCVEQTLSRFVPTVMVKKALVELGIPLNKLKTKLDPDEIDKMVKAGLKRLYNFQHSSGGWGWWKTDPDNNLMSSLVVFGLIQAQKSGYSINKYRLRKAISYLKRTVRHEENLNVKAYMLYALSFVKQTNRKVLNEVYKKRNDLKIYTMSLLAMTLNNLGRKRQAEILVSNLEDYVTVKKNQAWWGRYKGYYFWYDDAIETTAAVVKAFVNIKPNHKLLYKAIRWLVNNRRGMNWKSTKDTAAVIYAFIDFIKVKKEQYKRYKLRITFNGRRVTNKNLAGYQILAMNNVFEIPYSWVRTGRNRLVISKSGLGMTYYSAFLKYFTKENKIKRAGNLIHITRRYIRLRPVVDGRRIKYKRLPFKGKLKSGDLLEVHLTIKTENDFSYLMINDPKPAGCEPVNVRSRGGYYSHFEFRDTKVSIFLSYLRQGTHKVIYRLRSEIPGRFSQMPARVESMYVPEFRGSSDSNWVIIRD